VIVIVPSSLSQALLGEKLLSEIIIDFIGFGIVNAHAEIFGDDLLLNLQYFYRFDNFQIRP
jgi:hypothetical protein